MSKAAVGAVLAALVLAIGHSSVAWADEGPSGQVSFVGCKSDGQAGPRPAPTSRGNAPTLPQSLATKLAYYSSEDLGVLAPRGWHCFGLHGSNGSILIVTPERHSASALLKPNAKLTGPAVQLSVSSGETSGRFEVAEIAARLFPSKQEFVDGVVAEGIEPESAFPKGPYPDDILRRRGDSDVEFETPAQKDGMGTRSRLVKNGEPIDGLAIMTDKNDLVLLDVRVSSALRDFIPAIMQTLRRQYGVSAR
jgi:hypothetical protein